MHTVIFWFRNDLRLHDQAALLAACATRPDRLLAVYCLPDDSATPWGFPRIGVPRRAWLQATLRDLQHQLTVLGCPLLVCPDTAAQALPRIAQQYGATQVFCEDIAAPEEQQEVNALRQAGLEITTVWQSSLLDPATLPWPASGLPASFTTFRQAVEQRAILPPAPLPAPLSLPAAPQDMTGSTKTVAQTSETPQTDRCNATSTASDPRSSIAILGAGETAALAQLEHYLASDLPVSYKRTRNQLSGQDFSSKWSIWLANGALSARTIYARLKEHEAHAGVSDGSYWLWFELLWRDYFRLLHLQYGQQLYRAGGLSGKAPPPHDPASFQRWCLGQTGVPLVDAAMHELHHSGYLSNRLRQVVASYLLNELQGDWRAGAAWFEACLVDYDVYSNHGNWLYIAGCGTDPRGGRHFNIDKQTADHDGDGSYRRLWAEKQPK